MMLADAVIGFVAYMLRDKLTGHMAEDWQDICDFSLGLAYGFLPLLAMFQVLTPVKREDFIQGVINEVSIEDLTNGPVILHRDPHVPDERLRLTTSYVLSFVAFVAGAVIGFRFFPMEKDNGR
jgi:hypothetical protein